MDVLGILVGAAIGIALDRLVGQALDDRVRDLLRKARYRKLNAQWAQSELLSGSLRIAQAGWGSDGCFPARSVSFLLAAEFEPTPLGVALREAHARDWSDSGMVNGRQVGVHEPPEALRVSDDPTDGQSGRSHSLRIECHEYDYFDFLATHLLRLVGTDEEKDSLCQLIASGPAVPPLKGFPTPLSLGLSVLPDDGNTVALVRRSATAASGGWWHGGAIFNAVGENCARRDFAPDPLTGVLTSYPEVVAHRGLHEELGLGPADIAEASIGIHTFATASDLLDFKFFGFVITRLSAGELAMRHQAAPDRNEGDLLLTFDISTGAKCRSLIREMRANPQDWAPEAVLSTLRTLLVLRRIQPSDLRRSKR